MVPNTKFSKFCLKSLMKKFPDRFAGMAWNCHIRYMIFYTYLGENFYFAQCLGICGISWNQGVCLKGHFGEKTSLNPSQFLVLLKMVWHMHKDDGDKDFQSSLLSNIQFWQFLQSHTFSFGRFHGPWYTVL